MVSDLFFNAEQFDWMLLQFVALDDQLADEDVIGHSYLIYGMLKCIAVLRMVILCDVIFCYHLSSHCSHSLGVI